MTQTSIETETFWLVVTICLPFKNIY